MNGLTSGRMPGQPPDLDNYVLASFRRASPRGYGLLHHGIDGRFHFASAHCKTASAAIRRGSCVLGRLSGSLGGRTFGCPAPVSPKDRKARFERPITPAQPMVELQAGLELSLPAQRALPHDRDPPSDSRRARWLRLSRSTLAWNLARQNSSRVAGVVAYGHPE